MKRLKMAWCLPLLTLSGLALSGCAAIDNSMQSLQKSIQDLTAPTTTDSITQICQASKQNPVRATNTYVGQALPVYAQLKRIDDDFLASLSAGKTYRLILETEGAAIVLSSNNKSKVSSLNIGDRINASGVIEHISNDYSGCIISLKYAIL